MSDEPELNIKSYPVLPEIQAAFEKAEEAADLDLCEEIDFSRQGDDGGRCIRETGHEGNHVTFQTSQRTLYFWKWEDGKGRQVLHVDLKPGEPFTREEAAALYAYVEVWRESRRPHTQ